MAKPGEREQERVSGLFAAVASHLISPRLVTDDRVWRVGNAEHGWHGEAASGFDIVDRRAVRGCYGRGAGETRETDQTPFFPFFDGSERGIFLDSHLQRWGYRLRRAWHAIQSECPQLWRG